ncbi:hypothetical protein B0H10DRAFT_2235908 [Mycena sp. CBHHK59/15]|nr:hypothetical protein B0H10DRAFT_2235908 [Mycena sp. CBHHK59/15]
MVWLKHASCVWLMCVHRAVGGLADAPPLFLPSSPSSFLLPAAAPPLLLLLHLLLLFLRASLSSHTTIAPASFRAHAHSSVSPSSSWSSLSSLFLFSSSRSLPRLASYQYVFSHHPALLRPSCDRGRVDTLGRVTRATIALFLVLPLLVPYPAMRGRVDALGRMRANGTTETTLTTRR